MSGRALIVFEVNLGSDKQPDPAWAWGLVADGAVGFLDLSFTEADGFTHRDAPENVSLAGARVLFTVPVPEDEA